MSIPLRVFIVALILVAAITGAVGYFYAKKTVPAKVEIKEVEIVKEVEVIKKDVKIVEKVIERPDGTKESERVIEERSIETSTKDLQKVAQTQVDYRHKWRLGYMYAPAGTEIHGIFVERRITNRIVGGLFTQSNGATGVMIGFEF
ncbi:MAG: hypothetical protein QXT45_07735 [Candidatus Bilamarchaeaceae archaeon]